MRTAKFTRVWAFSFVLGILFPLSISLFHIPQQEVQAAQGVPVSETEILNGSYKFINRAYIEGTFGSAKITFRDKNIFDLDHTYMATEGEDEGACYGKIIVAASIVKRYRYMDNSVVQRGARSAVPIEHIDIDYKTGGAGECRNLSGGTLTPASKLSSPSITSNGKHRLWFNWRDADTIVSNSAGSNPEKGELYTRAKGSGFSQNLFIRNSNGGGCGDFIVQKGNSSGSLYRLEGNKPGGHDGIEELGSSSDANILKPVFPNNCEIWGVTIYDVPDVNKDLSDKISAVLFDIGGQENRTNPSGSNEESGGTGGGSDANVEEAGGCEATITGFIAFIVCEIVAGVDKMFSFFDTIINDQLTIGVEKFNESANNPDASGPKYYRVWSVFRYISLSLLVIMGLIMVISQAIGVGVFDAYTVKKVLPRILAAVILISISWQLCKLAIGITNALGQSVQALVFVPFGGKDEVVQGFLGGIGGNTAGGGVGGGTNGAVASGTFLMGGLALGVGAIIGGWALLTLAVTAALALLVGFFVVVLREIVVTILVLSAPLAIISFVLPNTEKLWSFWKDSFSKALLMFPLIVGFISLGKAFAYVTITSGGGDFDAMLAIIAFVAFFGPYFLLPKTLSFAGGLLSTLGGGLNDKSRGAFDRLKNYRRQQASERFGKARNYSLFKSDKLNSIAGAATNPWRDLRPRKGADGKWGTGIAVGRTAGQKIQGAKNIESDQVAQAWAQDDNYQLAVASRTMAVDKINRAKDEKNKLNEQLQAAELIANDRSQSDERRAQAAKEAEKLSKSIRGKNMDILTRQTALDAADSTRHQHTNATRRQALSKLASTGYQFAGGDAGYEELASIAAEIAGSDTSGDFAAIMDDAQYNLKNAGRADLAGLNHGGGSDVKSGVRKLNSWNRGQGKTEIYHGAAGAWLGSDVIDKTTKKTASETEMSDAIALKLSTGSLTDDEVMEYYEMLDGDFSGASDANKIEIKKQIAAIEAAASKGAGTTAARISAFKDERRRRSSAEVPLAERDPK